MTCGFSIPSHESFILSNRDVIYFVLCSAAAVQEIVTSEEDENVVAIREKRQTNDSSTETGNDKNDNRLSPVKSRKFVLVSDSRQNARVARSIFYFSHLARNKLISMTEAFLGQNYEKFR